MCKEQKIYFIKKVEITMLGVEITCAAILELEMKCVAIVRQTNKICNNVITYSFK